MATKVPKKKAPAKPRKDVRTKIKGTNTVNVRAAKKPGPKKK